MSLSSLTIEELEDVFRKEYDIFEKKFTSADGKKPIFHIGWFDDAYFNPQKYVVNENDPFTGDILKQRVIGAIELLRAIINEDWNVLHSTDITPEPL